MNRRQAASILLPTEERGSRMSFIQLANQYLEDLWELRDRRMDKYPMMYSLWPTVLLCSFYVLMVTVVLPRLMRSQRPLHLKGIIAAYNGLMLGFILWMICKGVKHILAAGYSLRYMFCGVIVKV